MAASSKQLDDESTPLLGGDTLDDRDTIGPSVGVGLGTGASDSIGGPSDPPQKLPAQRQPIKSSTNGSWGDVVGLPERGPNDENLMLFRRALGIQNRAAASIDPGAVEEGRKTATGIYALILRHQRRKRVQYLLLLALIYLCHFAQVVLGAVLTVLGPRAQDHKIAITILGAINTVVAGFLALITRLGAAEKLHKDEVQFRKLQTWIEETDTLLALGVIGRDRTEVGVLIQTAYRKYNSSEENEETNQPGALIPNTNRLAPDFDTDDESSTPVGERGGKNKASGQTRRWFHW
ncbi:hypothetical protein GQ53DRAFT_740337 [Thozetella sp. PMI_491]|nr:hypothetical protein GQ53DRAFT_740337 [Thozetella sp. PMI_491]